MSGKHSLVEASMSRTCVLGDTVFCASVQVYRSTCSLLCTSSATVKIG